MISKPYVPRTTSTSRLQRAGDNAERQLAHYLNRAFSHVSGVYVLFDLRLIDEFATEQTGAKRVCQLDALVVHRFGFYIVESKSISGSVEIRDDGAGGDEWIVVRSGQPRGMPSPVEQVRRQGEVMRRILVREHTRLLGRMDRGFRTLCRLLHGTDQKNFGGAPIQPVIALSDQTVVHRYKEPSSWSDEFPPIIGKADQVARHIAEDIRRHDGPLLTKPTGSKYGIWSMTPAETQGVAAFLRTRDRPIERSAPSPEPTKPTAPQQPAANASAAERSPRSTPPPTPKPKHPVESPDAPPLAKRCRDCNSTKLSARSGRFGYYWNCLDCGGNTPMPQRCLACGVGARGDSRTRITKRKRVYTLHCNACGVTQQVWVEPERPAAAPPGTTPSARHAKHP